MGNHLHNSPGPEQSHVQREVPGDTTGVSDTDQRAASLSLDRGKHGPAWAF